MKTKLQTQLEEAVKGLQKYADDLDAKGGELTGDSLVELRNRMDAVKSLKEQVTAEGDAKGAIAEAQAFMAALGGGDAGEAGKSAAFSSGETAWGGRMDTRGKTLGELFTESEVYRDFVGKHARGGKIAETAKGIQSDAYRVDSKALVTGASSTSGGAYVVNDRYGPTVDLIGERELTVADLVTQGTTESDTVEYVRVTAKTNNAAQVAEATSAALPTQNGTTGALINNAGGGYKPESDLTTEVVSTVVKTTAHWIPITRRAIADAGQVRTLVNAFLLYGLDEKLEDGILNGSGSGEAFPGILQTSGIQTVGSAGTDIDAVVDAIAAVRTTGRRRPNALVIHPGDWYSTGFLLAKESGTGRYILGDPRASIDQLNTLWGLQVVVTEAMTQNTALVGDFRQAVLWKREAPQLLVSDQHADFFVRNLLVILAERRDAFGVLDPQAFCTVTAV